MNDRYPLHPFRIHKRETLCEIMRTWPLATLISGSAGRAKLTLAPLLVYEEQEKLRLLGYVDANNEHAKVLRLGEKVSFHFQGPDAYASPDLYPDPQLPGWLYVSVQGHGVIEEELDDSDSRFLLMESTMDFGGSGQEFGLDPFETRVDDNLLGIRAFRIRVERISGIAKLAQDKGEADARLAVEHLESRCDDRGRALLARLLEETLGSSD